MKEKKGYKSVLLIALSLLVLITISDFVEPLPWVNMPDPLQEQVQGDVPGYSIFKGINTPWCCEWTTGLQN